MKSLGENKVVELLVLAGIVHMMCHVHHQIKLHRGIYTFIVEIEMWVDEDNIESKGGIDGIVNKQKASAYLS